MKIGKRQIGDSAPVYVIAEIGVNHDGSPKRAMELVEMAAEAGADAVKFQFFRTDLLLGRAAKLAAYQRAAGESDPVGMLRRLELGIEDLRPLAARARELGMHAIVTVFSVDLIAQAETIPWEAYKTASPDLIHEPLLRALAATGKPLIVSTGAATHGEVSRAFAWIGGDPAAFLQCVSSYPTRPEDASIRGMEGVRGATSPTTRVGYSDHTRDVDTGALAAAWGASILEKHLTYSKRASGPDHAASLEPAEFRVYASMARDESAMRQWANGRLPRGDDPRLGPPEKRVLECERDVRTVSRQSVTATRDLRAGGILAMADLIVKRPGTGLEPWRLRDLPGRRLRREVAADMPIGPGDVEGLEDPP
jgi:N,N'-diacetyllegionaminate synthase